MTERSQIASVPNPIRTVGPRKGEGGVGRLSLPSAHYRRRRWAVVQDGIDWDSVHTVLDLGGTPLTWQRSGLHDRDIAVTCVNVIGQPRTERFGSLRVDMVRGDATDPAWIDHRFDLVFSNSVIEHVGGWDAIVRFAEVTRSGRQYFVQTPHRYFLVEPHFILPLHYAMPRVLKTAILTVWDRGPRRRPWADARDRVDSIRLLSGGDMRRLFPDAFLIRERRWGHTKSVMAIRSPHAAQNALPAVI